MKKTFTILSVFGGLLLSGSSFGQIIFQVKEPSQVEGFYSFDHNPDWGSDLNISANAVEEFGVFVDDGTTGDSLGCNTLTNGADLTGKIAFVYRGDCEFGRKAKRAQDAGAIAVVVINNASGPIAMGAGADGGGVTIPVVSIGFETGELLREYIVDEKLKVFIGSKVGLFANDLAFFQADIIRPEHSAIPSLLAQDSSEYLVHTGAIVRNLGANTQTNVQLKAEVSLNGTIIFADSLNVGTLASGDTSEVTLADFTLPNPDVAKYTLIYTISSDSTDDAANDNVITQDFYITDGLFAKSRINEVTNLPAPTTYGASASQTAIKWGLLLNAVKGSRVKVNSFSFASRISSNSTDDLAGETVTAYVYEWTDADQNGGLADNELRTLAVSFFTYDDNSQAEQYVTIDFEDTPELADGKIYYLAVAYEGNKSLLFPIDGITDYSSTILAYERSINPLYTSQWYGGGFIGATFALGVNIALNDVSISENETDLNLKVYPNPATDMVNVTFGNAVSNAKVSVDVIDITGRKVLNKNFAIGNAENYVSINTSTLSNGTYFFNVNVNGKAVKSLPVVISK